MAVGWPADARAQSETITFDIPSQPIASALVAFARQAGVQLVMSEEPSGGVAANAVRGALDRERALARLLEGTGYEGRFEDGAIRLWRVSAGESESRQRGAGNEYDGELLQLAQRGAARESVHDEGEAREERRPSDEDSEEEIVVVGTNIRGVYPASSPVEIYAAEDIARTGATTTEQFIQKLPQNLGTVTPLSSNNRESVTGVDLRGLGVGTTLVLMNGRRLSLSNSGRTADVSLIPASAVARVEVLTDGASAIYGSDAIGGVVNFVLREDFEGAETRFSYGGVTEGGLLQGNFTQTLGRQWSSGRGLVSYDFFSASALDREDRSYAAEAAPGTLTPHDSRHNFLATFTQDLSERLVANSDISLSWRDTKTRGSDHTSSNPLNHTINAETSETEQRFINLGFDYQITDKLDASLLASYSENEVDIRRITTRPNNPAAAPTFLESNNKYSAVDATAMLDGSLFALPGGDARFSIGAGVLDERYSGDNQLSQSTGSEIGRRTTYAFIELFAPLISSAQSISLFQRLELSLAARYTGTEDASNPSADRQFGDAIDPKIGLLWAPTASLNLRATYGTSFRAPSLLQLDPVNSSRGQFFVNLPVPQPNGTPSTVLSITGVSPDLRAETAETYTTGLDFRPESLPGFQLRITYFNIDYTDRIARPIFVPNPLFTPDEFPELLTRNPSATTIEHILRTTNVLVNPTGVDLTDAAAAAALFAADPNFWVFENRFQNLSLSKEDGIDVSASNTFDTPLGDFRIGAQVTRILDYKQQALASKPEVTVVDTVGLPVDLRGRVYVGLSRDRFDGTLSVNYVDDYANPETATNSGANVESWTTVDLNVAYNFGSDGRSDILRDLRVSVSALNALDEDPPFVERAVLASRFGFDEANANALGRFIVFGISKSW